MFSKAEEPNAIEISAIKQVDSGETHRDFKY